MTRNSKHLLTIWIIAVVPCGLVLAGLILAFRRGDYIPAVVVPVVLIFLFVMFRQVRRKVLLLFQDTTPDRAISFYRESSRTLPNGSAMAAYQAAFVAVLYGQFDRARVELTGVNWSGLPPFYQGLETYIHSLLAIFEAKDYLRAVNLAQNACDLCVAAKIFPGTKSSRMSLDANLSVCKLLAGETTPELLQKIKNAIGDLSGVAPAVPAWAMAVHHTRLGEREAAMEYVEVVRKLTPHCAPLSDLLSAK